MASAKRAATGIRTFDTEYRLGRAEEAGLPPLRLGRRQPRSGDSSVAQRVSAGDRDPIPMEPRSGGISLDRASVGVAAPRLTHNDV